MAGAPDGGCAGWMEDADVIKDLPVVREHRQC